MQPIDDNQYHPCDSTNKLWFNKGLNSFIYSQVPIFLNPEKISFIDFIQNPINSIIDSIKRLITSPPYDQSFINSIKRFDKIYISQQSGKSLRGSIDGKDFKNVVVEYSGFNSNICTFIDQYNGAKKDASSGISCANDGSNYYVLAQGTANTGVNPEQIWPDLTSKLRIR